MTLAPAAAPGRWNLRSRAGRLFGRDRSGGVVLLFHRVAELESDPQLLAVTPRIFEQQIAAVRESFAVLPLHEMIERAATGRLPHRAAAVTFDDGYADNLLIAKLILEKYAVAATVFVASGFVDGDTEFYWDALERLLLRPARLPRVLTITAEEWAPSWTIESEPVPPAWHAEVGGESTGRRRAYLDLCDRLRTMTHTQRHDILDQLHRWANVPSTARSIHRTMTRGQLRELTTGGLIDIGAHTVDHVQLSALSEPAQREQIVASRRQLEALLGRPVGLFSYPYGNRPHYTPETVNLVQAAGFRGACSNFAGVVRSKTSTLELPRILVRPCDGRQLIKQLTEAFA